MKRRPYVPKEYQPLMTDFMLDVKRCGLWARMGLGKTSSVLTAVDMLYQAGYETLPTLVLAPLRVAAKTWPAEAEKWEHLRNVETFPIIGDAKTRLRMAEHAFARSLREGNASVYTLNYENIPWLIEFLKGMDGGFKWPFSTVISDESTKLKGLRMSYRTSKTGKKFLAGQGGKRTKLLASVAHAHTNRWVNLTGTPSPNGLKDLWGQTWFLDGGERLGRTYDAFSKRWFSKAFDGHGVDPLPFAQEQIQERLKDICISLDPADYFDLEKPIEHTIEVEIPEKARAQYVEMEKRMYVELEGEFKKHKVEALNAAAKTMKCLQLANGAAYVDGDDEQRAKKWVEVHTAKLDALEDIIEEAAGEPVLVSYFFKSDLARLKKRFPQGRELDDNPATQDEWNAGNIPVMFAHPASAGHGLNLQDGGNILVFFSLTWDLEHYEQIIERIGPMRQLQAGHDRPVFIYYIVVRKTIEAHVKRRLETKKSVQDILMDALKAEK